VPRRLSDDSHRASLRQAAHSTPPLPATDTDTDWPSYNKTRTGHRYAGLAPITTAKVRVLGLPPVVASITASR